MSNPVPQKRTFSCSIRQQESCHIVRGQSSTQSMQCSIIPTPPGETIAAGSSMSNAATLPTANPYPLWMSGIPMEDPTMPGKSNKYSVPAAVACNISRPFRLCTWKCGYICKLLHSPCEATTCCGQLFADQFQKLWACIEACWNVHSFHIACKQCSRY